MRAASVLLKGTGDLGHASAQTVLRCADQHDATTDAEIRSWRRRKITAHSGS